MSPGELAAADHIQPQSLTRALAGLERDGLIIRTADPHDHRRARVELAAEALGVLHADMRQRDLWLAQSITEQPPAFCTAPSVKPRRAWDTRRRPDLTRVGDDEGSVTDLRTYLGRMRRERLEDNAAVVTDGECHDRPESIESQCARLSGMETDRHRVRPV
jgi:hypothetical protein